MPRSVTISAIVPVYGGARTLPELVSRLLAVLPSIAREFEIVLVNDASPDDAWRVIQTLAAAHPEVRGIDLTRNYGQHNALLCGIRSARYELIATLDDDLQNRPEDLVALLAGLTGDVDVVYGVPRRGRHSLARRFASRAT